MRVVPCIAAAALALCALCAAAQTPSPGAAPPTRSAEAPLGLAEVLQAARRNADVLLASEQAQAARADVLAADHAPAPVLSGSAGSIDLQNGIGPGNVLWGKRIDKKLGLDWTLERGNKRALRTEAARQGAEAAALALDDTALQQQLAAAAAFYDLLAAQQRVQQMQALGQHAAELSAADQKRQRAGDISQQAALRTEVEARRVQADLHAAQAQQQKAAVALAQLTALPMPLQVQAEWPAAGSLPGSLPAIDSRPDVRAAQRRVAAAEAALQSAQALRKNDLTVGASVEHFPGTSNRMVELRLQMPLAGMLGNYGYEGEIARARAELAQAGAQLEKTRIAAEAEHARLRAELDAAAARSAEFVNTLVPRARQVADMSELAWQRGASSVTELIDARRTLRAVLLDEIDVRADYARALAAWQLRQAAASE